MQTEDLELIQRIEGIVGKTIEQTRLVQRGYTPAKRLIVTFTDGSSLFAKVGTNGLTNQWLRQEHQIYESLSGSFMPTYHGWDDNESQPILLLEDLSKAHWPPPWRGQEIEQVIEALQKVWSSSLPNRPSLTQETDLLEGWQRVAKEPEPFLSLGMASGQWLEEALPQLLAIDPVETAKGDSLLHLDLRSDNICILPNRAVLIDWNNAFVGSWRFDLGAWLPSLEMEGGPKPEEILPDAGDIACLISGYFASKAGLPIIPDAPYVRQIQQVQLRSALPWVVRALDLPPLDGVGIKEG